MNQHHFKLIPLLFDFILENFGTAGLTYNDFVIEFNKLDQRCRLIEQIHMTIIHDNHIIVSYAHETFHTYIKLLEEIGAAELYIAQFAPDGSSARLLVNRIDKDTIAANPNALARLL